MNPKSKVWLTLCGNLFLLIIITTLIFIFQSENSTYFRFGPSKDLIVISAIIDNWTKYTLVLLLIGFIKIIDTISNELGMPVLGFNIYNPDKKHITEFSKNELQFYANATFMVSGIRATLMMVVSVTQIDLALFSTMISEIASFYTIRVLLNEKTFGEEEKKEEITEIEKSLIDNMV
jgi:hypothetical protein